MKQAIFETSKGTIRLRLFEQDSQDCDNFESLCEKQVYDGLTFHRVIPAS